MPTYEFRCPAGHKFEKFYRKIGDAPASVECPTCQQEAQRMVSGGAGLHFKGSGFYITDYGRKGQSGGESSGGESQAGDTSASSSKPAETKDSASKKSPASE